MPRLWVHDEGGLEATRDRIQQSDPAVADSVLRLKAAATSAMAMAPVTVTDKPNLPPSGDKRDYMSIGGYWWPNPLKADGRQPHELERTQPS